MNFVTKEILDYAKEHGIKEEIKYGILHTHTENSLKDSAVKVSNLISYAKNNHIPSVALTDHGVLTGIFEFVKGCKNTGVNAIAGMECYVKEHEGDKRLHLVIMAKDYQGYQAMMKATKLANSRMEKVRTMLFPLMNEKILKSCFGKGSSGYGHVVATSACIGGILAGLYGQNEERKKVFEKINERYEKGQMAIKVYNANQDIISDIEKRISNETDDEKIKALKEQKKLISKRQSLIKNNLPGSETIEKLKAELDTLKTSVVCNTRDELIDYMEKEAVRYRDIFGEDNFYIELQYHGMPEEKQWFNELDKIAQKLNIPTVAANDAHMLTNSEADIFSRENVCALKFAKHEKLSEDAKELYIKNDLELFAAVANVVGCKRAETALKNIEKITSVCHMEFPNAQHYPVFDKNQDSFELLKKYVNEGIEKRFPSGFPNVEYEKRVKYELEVIKQMNVSDYHLIVQDLLRFGRKLGRMPEDRYSYLEEHIYDMAYEEILEYVNADQSYVGYTVGPGRGSSAGSLVCYLLGITDIDPIKHGLLFERYLNPERVTMPDIDSDYAFGYRNVVIAYTYKKYGADAVCRIISYSVSSAKAAIKDLAKAYGEAENAADKYDRAYTKLSGIVKGTQGDVLSNYEEEWKKLTDRYEINLLNAARSIEGTYNHYGMHAAGVVISDNDDINEYLPLLWDETNKTWKCQLNKEEVEENGCLKMDYLGLRNLNMITEILRLIYKKTGIRIDPSTDIEFEDAKVIRSICDNGDTNGIFQLESDGMKDICRKMKPSSFSDLVLLIAAYRPGPMDSIPDIIAVKNGIKKITYPTEKLAPIVDVTYGALIYQEQVQQVFRDLAGYSYGQADMVRRAMSKKKENILLAEREAFLNGDEKRNIKGCSANGISNDVANGIFDSMVDFAKYAFNKSHAAAYARITYILMWLKHYYFNEFMTVLLKWASDSTRIKLIGECREKGLEVTVPDINKAGMDFSIIDGKIMFGLTSIKGIGAVEPIIEARKDSPYKSFADFFCRGHFKKDVTENLIQAGAFDEMCKNRMALLSTFKVLNEIADKRKSVIKNLQNAQAILDVLIRMQGCSDEQIMKVLKKELNYKNKTVPGIEKQKMNVKKYEEKIEEFNSRIADVDIYNAIDEDIDAKLNKEKELIGVYVTGNPVDGYQMPESATAINGLTKGKNTILGVIQDIKFTNRKKDNAPMAIFNMEDRTGVITVICTTDALEKFKTELVNGRVVVVSGDVFEEEQEAVVQNEDAEEENEPCIVLKMILKSPHYSGYTNIQPAVKKKKNICMFVRDIADMLDTIPKIEDKFENPGSPYMLVFYDEVFGEFHQTDIPVSERILEMPKTAFM